MSDDLKKEYKRLRSWLNPTIRGKNTDAILESMATGTKFLLDTSQAVEDQLYITTASERYLDERMADRDIVRPDNVGLSDEVFRKIGIEVSNRKQVRDLIHNILEIMYGAEFTRAFHRSTELEPYQLEDGDTLLLQFDGEEPVEITFSANQFQSINAATAQEVADAIVRGLRNEGRTGTAFARDDGDGGFVTVMSSSNGPASSVKVLGGKAQTVLKFPEIRQVSSDELTQWTIEVQPSGLTRLVWTGGTNPFLGRVFKDDYINIYGTAFDEGNRGTFTILNVQGGESGNAYVEYENINAVDEVTLQGDPEGVLFFNPKRSVVTSRLNYAVGFQSEERLFEVFMPATTKVVRRERQGAAHLHESGASDLDQLGPYAFDTTKGYLIGDESCTSSAVIDSRTERVLNVIGAEDIPDEEGFLVFGFGTSKEEGPVPYIARPSDETLLIDPSYRFKNVHEVGTDISIISQNFPYDVEKDGSDYPFYSTDMVSGRIYAEDLIDLVKAIGIRVEIIILYPSDEGLGKWGDYKNSERYYVWGKDATDTLFDEDEINDRI